MNFRSYNQRNNSCIWLMCWGWCAGVAMSSYWLMCWGWCAGIAMSSYWLMCWGGCAGIVDSVLAWQKAKTPDRKQTLEQQEHPILGSAEVQVCISIAQVISTYYTCDSRPAFLSSTAANASKTYPMVVEFWKKTANNKPKLHFQGVLRCKWNLCGSAPTHRAECSRPERTETCVARNRKEWPTLSNQMSRLRPDHLSAKFNCQKCASMILSYTHIKSVWKSETPSIDRLFQYQAVQGQTPSCKML